MFKFEEFKNRKLNEISEEDAMQKWQELGFEMDNNMEDKIVLTKGYSLVLYIEKIGPLDDPKNPKWVVLLSNEKREIEDNINFIRAYENDFVTVNDYDVYVEEYMSSEEKSVLRNFGLKFGKKYSNIFSFWKHCKELEKKMKKDVEI